MDWYYDAIDIERHFSHALYILNDYPSICLNVFVKTINVLQDKYSMQLPFNK